VSRLAWALAVLAAAPLAAWAPRPVRPKAPLKAAQAPQAPPQMPALPPQPAPQTFQLATGLSCVLVENHERPLIRMVVASRWDRSELPQGKEGIGGFLAMAMAAGGAGPNSHAAFLRALDALGMSFGFKARMGCYQWTMVADSRSQETAMELLADAVARPVFDGPLVEGQRQALLRRFASGSLRERAQARFLWSIDDPGTLLPPRAEAVDRIEYQDLLDFRRRVVRPENSTLVLYGDLNLAQARQLALMHLGIWGPVAQPAVAGIPPKAGTANVPQARLLAVLDSGPVAELWAGTSRPAGGGSPAAEALLPILLGRAAARCFGGLEMSFRLDQGRVLLIQAKVPAGDRDRLVAGCTAGLESLRRSGFTSEELACALLQWQAENASAPLHPGRMLDQILEGRLDPGLAQAVGRTTVKDLDQALNAWLDPGGLRFLLLGADAPLLQAAEKAGLAPSAVLRPED